MEPNIENALIILVACSISALVSLWFTRKSNKITAEILESKGESLFKALEDTMNEQLEPFLPLIKRSMTLAANAGASVKKVQAMEREIIRAVQDDLPITPEMISMVSPRLGEMLEESPELMPKLLQIGKRMGLFGPSEGGGLQGGSRPHPLGGREE